jgi:ribonuclease E
MPFLAYVAIILVSLGGILFELNWLTSPKLESKPAVQASATAAPPKVAEAAIAPRNVAPTVTLVPAASSAATAPAAAVAVSEPKTPPQPAEPAHQQAGTAPAISPAPFGVANAAASGDKAANSSPSETTAAGSTDFKREFTTDTKTTDTKAADEKSASAASTATFTPAATSSTPAAAVAASSNNKCDIASCSAAYQSFRASDCTYQPIDGTARKVCDRAPDTAQRAAAHETVQRASVSGASVPGASAPARDPRIEAATRKAGKDAELRAVEREVRRIAPSEAALDPGERRLDRSLDRHLLDRGFDRGSGGSEVIVIERPDRDW